jgi:hypothetical protein
VTCELRITISRTRSQSTSKDIRQDCD